MQRPPAQAGMEVGHAGLRCFHVNDFNRLTPKARQKERRALINSSPVQGGCDGVNQRRIGILRLRDPPQPRPQCELPTSDRIQQASRHQILNKAIGGGFGQIRMRAQIADRRAALLADDFKDQGQSVQMHNSHYTILVFSIYDTSGRLKGGDQIMDGACCGPGYASPQEAIQAPREKLLYTIAIYTGTGIQKPDYLATVDADPDSPTYSQVIHRLEMPGIGDELHHMGWNACSSCHDDSSMSRKYLLVPGVRSNNIHIVDTATDPRAPRLHKIIDGAEIKAKANLSGPHTVHCLGSEIIISFLGDAKGEAPGGYLHLNKEFEIIGRWENSMGDIPFGYDFWYQPRHNVMVSSEWAAPNTFMPGFDLEEVGHLKYGRRLHIWDFEKRVPVETLYLGEDGLIPLEVKFLHDPDSTHGFCGAALSANVIHFWKSDAGKWEWEKIIDVENEPHPEWPIPVPGVMSAILVSMDDKYLYLNNWLHGDMRQYDITDPHNPKLTGQVWMGGLLGRAPEVNGVKVAGGPQMFQLSLDGKRLYVTTSLFSTWDNQFYPEIRTQGGVMVMIDCDVENGGMSINPDFLVDFGQEPNGPSRCHETRYPGGDCTSDIWL